MKMCLAFVLGFVTLNTIVLLAVPGQPVSGSFPAVLIDCRLSLLSALVLRET